MAFIKIPFDLFYKNELSVKNHVIYTIKSIVHVKASLNKLLLSAKIIEQQNAVLDFLPKKILI